MLRGILGVVLTIVIAWTVGAARVAAGGDPSKEPDVESILTPVRDVTIRQYSDGSRRITAHGLDALRWVAGYLGERIAVLDTQASNPLQRSSSFARQLEVEVAALNRVMLESIARENGPSKSVSYGVCVSALGCNPFVSGYDPYLGQVAYGGVQHAVQAEIQMNGCGTTEGKARTFAYVETDQGTDSQLNEMSVYDDVFTIYAVAGLNGTNACLFASALTFVKEGGVIECNPAYEFYEAPADCWCPDCS